MDNMKNNEQNKNDVRALRDNFKDIKKFMDDENHGNKCTDGNQEQKNRDLRDNFKNI